MMIIKEEVFYFYHHLSSNSSGFGFVEGLKCVYSLPMYELGRFYLAIKIVSAEYFDRW